MHPTIKFTTELERDISFPFLDTFSMEEGNVDVNLNVSAYYLL